MSQDQAPTSSPPELIVQTPTAGAILAAQRQQLGMSIDDVSAKLKLSARQIESLETDRYDALPGNTFVRGFVRNYARLLQIDAQPLMHYLDSHLPQEVQQAALPRLQSETLPTLRPGGGERSSFWLALFGGLALVLLGAGGFWYVQLADQQPVLTLPEAPPPVVEAPVAAPSEPVTAEGSVPAADAGVVATPEVLTPAAAAVDPATAAPGTVASGPGATVSTVPAAQTVPSQPAAPAVVPSTAITAPAAPTAQATVVVPAPVAVVANTDIRVVARQESWVQITDATGRRLVNELLPAGQTRVVGGKPPYQVRIGNGHQTELYYKGKATELAPYIKVDVANLELN